MRWGVLAGIYLLYVLAALAVLAHFGLTVTGVVIATTMLLAALGLHLWLAHDEPKQRQGGREPRRHVHRGDLP